MLRGASHVSLIAVNRWIKKHVTLMQCYVEKINLPPMNNAWRTVELYVTIC